MGKTLKYKGGFKTRPYATGPEPVFDLKLLWPSLVASDKLFPNKGNLDKGFVAAGFSLCQHRRDAGATKPYPIVRVTFGHEQGFYVREFRWTEPTYVTPIYFSRRGFGGTLLFRKRRVPPKISIPNNQPWAGGSGRVLSNTSCVSADN